MQRIEINVLTGEKTVIDLTPEEEAAAAARTAEEAAQPDPASYEDRLTALEAWAVTMGYKI